MVGGELVERFRLEEDSRDYDCYFGVSFANIQGDAVPEIVAVGSRYVYIYSGEDGALLQQSEDLGWVPYGRATPELIDVNGDGLDELLLLTNNNWG